MASLYERYPVLEQEREQIEHAIEMIIDTYEHGGKVLLCGNGGSAADCDHIVGELMKGFLKKRPVSNEIREKIELFGEGVCVDYLQGGLPAISLVGQNALGSAFANDVNSEYIYAQQVLSLGKPGDVLIGISTSGNAKNVHRL